MELQPAIVITGANDGIGRELARQFARADKRALVLIARRSDALATLKQDLAQRDDRMFHVVAMDLTEEDAGGRVQRFLATHQLYCDVLVNNAGVGYSGLFSHQDADSVAEIIALNVDVPAQLTRVFLPDMCRRGEGGVLNMASLGGYVPGPGQALYYASKAFLISFTKAINQEVWGSGVRVSVVAPGPVETRFHAKMGAGSARYRWLLPHMSAGWVARIARIGFKYRVTVIFPDPISFAIAVVSRIVPNILLAPIVGFLLGPHRNKSRDNNG